MPIADLLELVEKLKGRIDRHGPALKQNEALTRYSLIDPLLRALGWDTEDPAVVVPEYPVGKGNRADYALLELTPAMAKNGPHPVRAAMIVEAKSLDTPLEEVIGQGVKYCFELGIEYFAVTDGRRWMIYKTLQPVPIAERKVVAFDLKEASAAEVCRKALALWRPGARSGQVTPAPPAVVNRLDDQVAAGSSPAATPPEPPVPPEGLWKDLSNLKKGKLKPIEIAFPDGERKPISSWKYILVEVVRWLITNDLLNEDKCPITVKQGAESYSVSTSPVQPSGARFYNPTKVGALYVNTHGQATYIIERTNFIITNVGQQPSQFKIRFPI